MVPIIIKKSIKETVYWHIYSHSDDGGCDKFIHSIGMCRIQRFLALLRSFFHSSLLYCFLPPFPTHYSSISLTPSCHLFLGLPLKLVVPKFIYNTLLEILLSSIICTCPNQCNLFKIIVSIIVGFLTLA